VAAHHEELGDPAMTQRSLASRFYRATTGRAARFLTVAGMLIGWTVVVLAQGTAGTIAEFQEHNVAMFGGGALAFMAVFAGISRWVADPAARKVLAEHTRDDVKAHPMLISRVEWSLEQARLNETILNLRLDLRGLIVELRRGGAISNHETADRS
jgi:hypothetical protein